MEEIKLPVFIVEDHDLAAYDSLDELKAHIEPVDVPVYKAYDAAGRLLELGTDGRSITVKLVKDEPAHAAELESLLRDFLRSRGAPEAYDQSCDLACLVRVAEKNFITYSSISRILRQFWNRIRRKA